MKIPKKYTKHFKYLKYITRHKFFVGLQCFRQGLIWRGIIHDWHKFLPSEWRPYVNHFYGPSKFREWMKSGKKTGKTGDDAFDYAHGKHIKRSDHHTEWWIREIDGEQVIFPMSEKARLEMMCDWWGVHMSLGKGGWESVKRWYAKSGQRLKMHDDTRKWIERFLEKQG